MGLPVVTVASGGMPIVEATLGTPVTEAANGRGLPVTKVIGKPGMPVTFETIGVSSAFAAFDIASAVNTTLSNSNLTATHANTVTSSGARSIAYKNSGKYYFEYTTSNSGTDLFGVITSAGTYLNAVAQVDKGAYVGISGAISAAGSTGSLTIGLITAGTIVGIAVDLDNDKVWFRKAPAGNWNGLVIGSENPVTNTGGVNIAVYSATSLAPMVGFGATTAGNNVIANFGASAFTGTVPSGFTAGWPA